MHLANTLGDLEAKALQAKAGTHCDTLGDVKAEALSDPLATTLAEK